ncbi:tetratricopeptide repeat protein [Zeaxanthinibacter enoshimensis]|uniref:Tetratricopeptide repeat protein n=1 Tax=Zeaxanthinibacter enoshimensis TaxID=392009 RepID=A0A4V3D449_9FLAO|nr:tetratricopeptide repeat protein [Zeaxanthinibacter enoshimensis]TDQ32941.1 tetratricopeptide repeat protein [Zeaxanthinibacter enoshimensis]
MKNIIFLISFLLVVPAIAQMGETQQEDEKAVKTSKNLTWEANEDLQENEFVSAEAKYRRAIDKSKTNVAAPYNLGNAYYERDSYLEAFGRFKEAGENAASKAEKHRAYHNMGNVFMKNKEYQKAVEAYKEALRNDPTDEETRYNLALAKEMLKKQQQEQPENQDKEDQQDKKEEENQDKEEQDGGDQQDNNDQQDENKGDKQDGEDGDQGEQEKEENKEGDGEEKQEKKEPQQSNQQQPRPNQLSPQQIENLLEAMQNEEKKVQEKMDAKKVKGVPLKNKKDW